MNTIAVLGVALLLGPFWLQNAEVKVKAIKITEVREAELGQPKKNPGDQSDGFFSFGSNELGLTIRIQLDGPAAGAATHYGHVKIKTAKLDSGANLKSIKPHSFGFDDPSEGFAKIDRDMMFMGQRDKPKDVLQFDLRFEPPPRGAERVQLVEGSLKLRVGERKDVLIAGVMKKIGKPVEDKTLKAAGVNVKVLDPKKAGVFGGGDPNTTVALEITGKLGALLDVGLVNDAGDSLNSGTMSSGGGNKKTYMLEADEKLPADTKLKITVAVGLKELTVPIKLENIALP